MLALVLTSPGTQGSFPHLRKRDDKQHTLLDFWQVNGTSEHPQITRMRPGTR